MSPLSFLLTLTPSVVPLLATALIPSACRTGSVVHKALYLYDAQVPIPAPNEKHAPTDTGRDSAAVRERKSSTSSPSSDILMCGFIFVAGCLLVTPPPLYLRTDPLMQIINRLRALVPTVVLALFICPLPQTAAHFLRRRPDERDAFISRTHAGDVHIDEGPSSFSSFFFFFGRLRKRVTPAAVLLALWPLPLPHNFWSLDPFELPRSPDHKALLIHLIGIAFGFVCALSLPLRDPLSYAGAWHRGTLLGRNILPLAFWALSLPLVPHGWVPDPPPATQKPPPQDGIAHVLCLLVVSAMQVLVILSVTPLFALLLRYEAAEAEVEARLRGGLIGKCGAGASLSDAAYVSLYQDSKNTDRKPVSYQRTAQLGASALCAPLRLRLRHSKIARPVLFLLLGLQLADLCNWRAYAAYGFPLWTEAGDARLIPVNLITLASVPLLSLFALFLARNNRLSLWRYTEEWDAPAAEGKVDRKEWLMCA